MPPNDDVGIDLRRLGAQRRFRHPVAQRHQRLLRVRHRRCNNVTLPRPLDSLFQRRIVCHAGDPAQRLKFRFGSSKGVCRVRRRLLVRDDLLRQLVRI